MTAGASLFPDLNSSDWVVITNWLLSIRTSDVINNRCVTVEHGGKFLVEGWKKPMVWNIAAARLAPLNPRPVKP